MVVRAAIAFVVIGAVGCTLTVAASGVPSVWAWFGWALMANAASIIITPMSTALALAPMADQAGTVSAILGLTQLGAGALLAALIDAQIDTTVTPMVAGSFVFGLIGLVCLVVATRTDQLIEPPR